MPCPDCDGLKLEVKRLSRLILRAHQREITALASYLKNYWHLDEINQYPKELLEKHSSPFMAYQEGQISLEKLTELIAQAVYEIGWRRYPTITEGITAGDMTQTMINNQVLNSLKAALAQLERAKERESALWGALELAAPRTYHELKEKMPQ